MKIREKEEARRLRKEGWSLGSIAKKVNCSKGTISIWIRDIPLTDLQIAELKSSQDRGRAKAANHPNSAKLKWGKIRADIEQRTKKEIPSSPTNEIFKIACAALYWGEGYKKSNSLFVFANSDPDMIRLMARFLLNTCRVPPDKLRGRVNIFPSADINKIEKYWSQVSGIPTRQFHVPLLAVSRSSKQRRKSLPYGTFRIIVSSVFLCSQFRGWIDGLRYWASSSAG